jgi:DNA repair exonuclease SbcCD ATPase subunit
MAIEKSSFVGLSVAVVLAILGISVAVKVSLNASRDRSGFRQEMAKRLDIEERLERALKEREMLTARLEDVRVEADRAGQEVVQVRQALERERADKAAIAAALEQSREALKAGVPAIQK